MLETVLWVVCVVLSILVVIRGGFRLACLTADHLEREDD